MDGKAMKRYSVSFLSKWKINYPRIKINYLIHVSSSSVLFRYRYRKQRERIGNIYNIIYFDDIKLFGVLGYTKPFNTDKRIEVIIIDKEEYSKEWGLYEHIDECPHLSYKDVYREDITPSAFESGLDLRNINRIRRSLGIPSMTKEEYMTPFVHKYLSLPLCEVKNAF